MQQSLTVECGIAADRRRAQVGYRVQYRDEVVDEVEQVVIVPHAEADFMSGRISADSPLAQALVGHVIGDGVRARTPGGIRRLTIIAVERAD